MIKKNKYLYIIIFLLSSILLWNSYVCWQKSEVPSKTYWNKRIQILKDPLTPQWTAYDFDIAYREDIQKTPYTIGYSTSHNAKNITVNFPFFLVQSEKDKQDFYNQFYSAWDFFLQINFASQEAINSYQLQSFVDKITQIPSWSHQKLKGINLSFYEYPSNYYVFFQQFSWYSEDIVDFEIWLNGPFPYWFYPDNFIHHTRDMIEKNISHKMVKSLRLYVNWSQWSTISLLKQGEIDLQHFPTSSLWTSGITISMEPTWYGQGTWRKKIQKFFKESIPERFEMQGFWLKENNWVVLYWF